jgi:hypothetical protein
VQLSVLRVNRGLADTEARRPFNNNELELTTFSKVTMSQLHRMPVPEHIKLDDQMRGDEGAITDLMIDAINMDGEVMELQKLIDPGLLRKGN